MANEKDCREVKVFENLKSAKTEKAYQVFKVAAQIILALLSAFAILGKDVFGVSALPDWLKWVGATCIGVMVILFLVAIFLKINYEREFVVVGRGITGKKIDKHIDKLLKLTIAIRKNKRNQFKISCNNAKELEKAVISGDEKIKVYQEPVDTKKFSQEDIELTVKAIKDIDHVLISTYKYKARIELGKFIEECSSNPAEVLRAKIDMLGWTYALRGQPGNCATAIYGAQVMFKKLEERNELPNLGDAHNKEKIDEIVDLAILKSRSYRHLAAAPNIRRVSENFGIPQIEEARRILFEVSELTGLSKEQKEKIKRNRIGVEFGQVEALYDHALIQYRKNDRNARNTLERACKFCLIFLSEKPNDEIDETRMFTTLDEIKGIDVHRYTKQLFIINKMIFLSKNLYGENEMQPYTAEFSKIYGTKIMENLNNAKEVLNSSIYVDEAVETYIQQRVEQVYNDIASKNKAGNENENTNNRSK